MRAQGAVHTGTRGAGVRARVQQGGDPQRHREHHNAADPREGWRRERVAGAQEREARTGREARRRGARLDARVERRRCHTSSHLPN